MLIMILLLLVVIIIPATIRMMSDGWDPVIHNNLLAGMRWRCMFSMATLSANRLILLDSFLQK